MQLDLYAVARTILLWRIRFVIGYKDIKRQVIHCLKKGLVSHEQRNNIDIKNLLAIGQVTLEQTADALRRSSGDSYSTSPHHLDPSIDVHIVKTIHAGKNWYIKWYFVEPNSVFISVHH